MPCGSSLNQACHTRSENSVNFQTHLHHYNFCLIPHPQLLDLTAERNTRTNLSIFTCFFHTPEKGIKVSCSKSVLAFLSFAWISTARYKAKKRKWVVGDDLDQTSKTVDINICRHYALVQLIPYMFLMAVLCIYPEYAFCLQLNHPYSVFSY